MRFIFGTLLCGVTVMLPLLFGLTIIPCLLAGFAFCGAVICFNDDKQNRKLDNRKRNG